MGRLSMSVPGVRLGNTRASPAMASKRHERCTSRGLGQWKGNDSGRCASLSQVEERRSEVECKGYCWDCDRMLDREGRPEGAKSDVFHSIKPASVQHMRLLASALLGPKLTARVRSVIRFDLRHVEMDGWS